MWSVWSYDNVGGYENHAFSCLDCFNQYLHYDNKYNIVIAAMSLESKANTVVLNNSKIKNDSNSKSDAVKLCDDIWNNLCVTGVHVVKRYVDLELYNDFSDRDTFEVGSQKTITVWAEEGVCGHKQSQMALKSENLTEMLQAELLQ